MGFLTIKQLNKEALLMSIYIGFAMVPIQLVHELSHYENDKLKSITTTAVALGINMTIWLIGLFLILWIIWVFILLSFTELPLPFLLLTILFSIFLFIFLLKYKAIGKLPNLKIKIRYLCIIYGIVISVIIIISHTKI
jgi:4-hydroxybenzoate polyprenyltransferase